MSEFQAESTENDNTSSSSNLSSPVASKLTDADTNSEMKGSTLSKLDLMPGIMLRLSRLEERVMVQAQEIESKDKRISALEEELRVRKETGSEIRSRDDLEQRYQQLQSQVSEMESFLSDYGLIWVGSGDTRERNQLWRPPENSMDKRSLMDFDLVLRRIQELNILAGEGETYIRTTTTGARLAKKEAVQLKLYHNGIVMFDGPFRSYEEQKTQQFIQDLMDGYFPSELQERFPDGVPFEVHDYRDEDFIPRPQRQSFPGYGQAIRGNDEEKQHLPHPVSGRKLSVDQFLNRLPQVVAKAGQVISIRESSPEALQGSSNTHSSGSVILIDTPALQEMKERLQTLKVERPVSSRDVTTLKMRSEDGNCTYVLKMNFSETIGDLRQYLDKHREDGQPDYDILSVYPQCCFGDNSQTLQSCGLTANAFLILRKRPAINK